MVSFFAVPWHGMNGHHNVTTWDGHSDGYGWLWSFRSPEVIPYGPDGMKIYQSESHDGRITNVPCYPCCDQSSNLAMYPWDHLDELNAGHQNLKAGQENGLKWDASRKFFRTIGLIQVYPLLHHDFPPISMANFNGRRLRAEVPQISPFDGVLLSIRAVQELLRFWKKDRCKLHSMWSLSASCKSAN